VDLTNVDTDRARQPLGVEVKISALSVQVQYFVLVRYVPVYRAPTWRIALNAPQSLRRWPVGYALLAP